MVFGCIPLICASDSDVVSLSHQRQTSQWLPPEESFTPSSDLPYGWEEAVNDDGTSYYINHVDRTTANKHPTADADPPDKEPDDDMPDVEDEGLIDDPEPRQVVLRRDAELGFGFIAGSEKPVIIRFVTEDGPSHDSLLPGDRIFEINGEDVKESPREHVIQLVKSCQEEMAITVCQPQLDNSQRKSALLTAAKRAKLRHKPSRVHFAEGISPDGPSEDGLTSLDESYVPLMPNVLKVFLENGQTKSFKYDTTTTVKDVVDSLHQKMNFTCPEHFALVLQNPKVPSHSKMVLLQDSEKLMDIASRPRAQQYKCLFRVAFMPQDAYDLLRKDTAAFEYFFIQCCNDVVRERFSSELKFDVALRLAALHIQQFTVNKNMSEKISIKSLEQEPGLSHFVSGTLLESVRPKDVRRLLAHYLRANHSLCAPGQKRLTDLQAKLHYLKIVSELRSFGGRTFLATFVEKKAEVILNVGPSQGICLVANIKNNKLTVLAEYYQLSSLCVTKENEGSLRIVVNLLESDKIQDPLITLLMLVDDANNFVAMVAGYYRLIAGRGQLLITCEPPTENNNVAGTVPPYEGKHSVIASDWSYVKPTDSPESATDSPRCVDLSSQPPDFPGKPVEEDKVQEEIASPESDRAEVKWVIGGDAPLASPDSCQSSPTEGDTVDGDVVTSATSDAQREHISRPDSLRKPTDVTKVSSEGSVVSDEPVSSMSDHIHPSYNPRLFVDGGLYLDPDIIDLTLLPPPKTPDDELDPSDLDTSRQMAAPESFTDECNRSVNISWDSLPSDIVDLPTPIREHIDALVLNDEDLGAQLAAMDALMFSDLPRSDQSAHNHANDSCSDSDSGNETISSENVELANASYIDFLTGASGSDVSHYQQVAPTSSSALDDFDIDEFIARVSVPPPPPVDGAADRRTAWNETATTDSSTYVDSTYFDETDRSSWTDSCDLEEEFAKLVTPPPPTHTDPSDIFIVPPIDDVPVSGHRIAPWVSRRDNTAPTSSKGAPLVPKRHSSLEANSPDQTTVRFWRPTDVASVTHQPTDNQTPTLTRQKKKAPPPPVRRSSMLSTSEKNSPTSPQAPPMDVAEIISTTSSPQRQSKHAHSLSDSACSPPTSTDRRLKSAHLSPLILTRQAEIKSAVAHDDYIVIRPSKSTVGRANTFNDKTPGSQTAVHKHNSFNGAHEPSRTFSTFFASDDQITSPRRLHDASETLPDFSHHSAELSTDHCGPSSPVPNGPNTANSSIGSVPTDSMAVAVERIMSSEYSQSDGFSAAIHDVQALTTALHCRTRLSSPAGHREQLTTVSRQFVADSKRLVRSATRPTDDLNAEVNTSMRTLASLVSHCHAVIPSVPRTVNLVPRVVQATEAYVSTLQAAALATGETLAHPAMKVLMKRATSLASSLSALMRVIRTVEQH